MIDLNGKVALITGAGSARGQGAAEARAMAAAGARVVIADLPESEGQRVADEIGAAAQFHVLDVTDADAWDRVVAAVVSDLGGIDCLVNNAGVWLAKPLVETTPEEFRQVVEVNQTGVFLGMRAVVPRMVGRGGVIVNISSNAGLRGAGMPHAYAASKWAVRGMSRAAAFELAPEGIRVNVILPGVIDTPMIHGGAPVLAKLAESIPVGRPGQPEEIARLVTFLASDECTYLTGAEIAVDGAFTA